MSFLCLKKDLPEEGRYGLFLDQDLKQFVVAVEKGVLKVAANRCRHRGFPVCQGDGALPIDCPYHGQRFFFESKAETEVVGDFVFLKKHRSTPPELLQKFELGQQFHQKVMQVRCTPWVWMQNTMDCNHLPFVHSGGFNEVFASHEPIVFGTEPTSFHSLLVKPEVVEFYRKHCVVPRETTEVFTHVTHNPHLSVTSFLGIFFSVETVFPTPYGIFTNTRFFTAKGATVPAAMLEAARDANDRILEEDRNICEQWAGGDPDQREVVWMSGEERIRHYFKGVFE